MSATRSPDDFGGEGGICGMRRIRVTRPGKVSNRSSIPKMYVWSTFSLYLIFFFLLKY